MRISDWSSDVCSSDLLTANEVLGGSTTSRLIMDLRETKGWAYYAGTALPGVKETIPLLVYAPVQTDKTGESIIAARKDISECLTAKGTTEAERNQTINRDRKSTRLTSSH